jgi:hypothetical protein
MLRSAALLLAAALAPLAADAASADRPPKVTASVDAAPTVDGSVRPRTDGDTWSGTDGGATRDPDQEVIDHLDLLERLDLLDHLGLVDASGEDDSPAPHAERSPP